MVTPWTEAPGSRWRGNCSAKASAERVAQAKSLDLAGRRLRQLRQELDPARTLVLGESLAHVLLQLATELRRTADAGTDDDERHRLDEPVVIFAPDDAALHHRRVRDERVLDLHGAHP